jgi:amino acid adenylation domain-containing protein
VKERLLRITRHKLVHDALALYGVQVCRKALPLIVVPYLAMTLKPKGWGLVAFMQSLAEFLVLAIEFGFSFSATREIARYQDNPHKCGEVMSGVLSAQALLSLGCTICAAIIAWTIPILRANPLLVAAGICYAVFQGFAPLWFFQGLERMKLCAVLEIVGKVAGCVCIFLFIHSPEDGWKVLGFQALAPAITSVLGLALAFRAIPCVRPRFHLMKASIVQGWPMFLLRGGESMYSIGNSFILGLFVSTTYVGYFAGADKITRAAFGLLIPIRDVLFPRVSNLATRSFEKAQRLARSGMVLMAAGGLALGAVQWIFAPRIVHILLGPEFVPSIAVLRIEAIYPVLVAITCSLGMQWLVPLGYDRQVLRITATAGALNIVLATLLAPHFAHVGMAWGIVTTETFISIGFLLMVAKTCPLWGKPRASYELQPESPEGAAIGKVSAEFFPTGDSPDIEVELTQEISENSTKTLNDYPADKTVVRLFEAQAAETPARHAAACGDRAWTYAELDREVNRLAHHLLNRGARRGDYIGICLDRSLEMLASMLAIMKMGGVYVPLDPRFPVDRLEYMATHSALAAIITHDRTEDTFPMRTRCIHLDRERDDIAAASSQPFPTEPAPTDAVYVLYTSGSTGKPKGVQIHHRGLVNFLWSMRSEPGIRESDVLLAVTTLSFDIAEMELLLPIVSGARVHIATGDESRDPKKLSRLIDSSGATILQATPGQWRMLLDSGWKGKAGFKMLCGGEPLRPPLAEALIPNGELWNMYGPTETTIWSSVCRITSSTAINVGAPIANTWFYVLDENRNPVPAGEKGELYIGGDSVADGYLHRPDLTAERFLTDPFREEPDARMYRTGDLASIRADGATEIFGRTDSQVKVRGFRIELGEIESVLAQCPLIRENAVVVKAEPTGEPALAAYFVALPSQDLPGEIRGFLKTKLPAYMVPSHLIQLPEMPRLPNGKINRNALPDLTEVVEPEANGGEGKDELESRLLSIWRSVLERRSIGRDTDFFDAGGSSILAARLFARIEKQLSKDLPLSTLLQAPTVAKLAAVIRDANWTPPWGTLVPICTGGSKPPLFLVHAIGGNIVSFRSFGSCFGGEQPVYGIQARGLDGKEEVSTSVEGMAADYIRAIRSVQPNGPYRIGGFSAGGIVAFEMARQLQREGEETALLLLLDTSIGSPDDIGSASEEFSAVERWKRMLLLNLRAVRHTDWKVFAGLKLRNWRMSLNIWAYGKGFGRLNTWEAFMVALRRYQPGPYTGNAVLFRAESELVEYPDPTFGWRPYIQGDLRIFDTKGDHDSFLSEEYIQSLGSELNRLLEAATPPAVEHAAGVAQ